MAATMTGMTAEQYGAELRRRLEAKAAECAAKAETLFDLAETYRVEGKTADYERVLASARCHFDKAAGYSSALGVMRGLDVDIKAGAI